MEIDLKGKKALVCGASKGIGRAAAEELARLGAQVTALARTESKLQDLVSSLEGSGHAYLSCDFSKPEELESKVNDYVAKNGPFHILVNNTGGPPAGPAHQATVDQFQNAFTQHLVGNHIMLQAVLEGMKSEGYGRIINVISTSVKLPLKGLGVSNTIRGAVANWAKTLANELGEFGITVNNVLPGATETDRLDEIFTGKAEKQGVSKEEIIRQGKSAIPAGRFGQPRELGQAIAFLASPAAAYINGINLPVDGGRTGCL